MKEVHYKIQTFLVLSDEANHRSEAATGGVL